MNFQEDITKAFSPLSNHVRSEDVNFDETMSQYMYMFHDENDVYHYKHIGDRSYLKVNAVGERVGGKLNDWKQWV